MSFYDDVAEIADTLLAEYGQAGVLGSVAVGEYDPAEGAATSASTPHAITTAIFAMPQRYIDGAMILTGDQRALVSAVGLAVAPKTGDTVTDALGAESRVIEAKGIAPAGTVVLWILQVRK